MKASFYFELTKNEVAAMRSLSKKVNGAMAMFELPVVEVTLYDQVLLALGCRKTFEWHGSKDGVQVNLEATAYKKGLSIRLEVEVHEAYIVEVHGIYEDAIGAFIPAIVAAVGGFVGATKLFEAKAEKRVNRLRKAIK